MSIVRRNYLLLLHFAAVQLCLGLIPATAFLNKLWVVADGIYCEEDYTVKHLPHTDSAL